MRQLGITLLISAFVLAGSSTFLLAQPGTVPEDPKTLLEKAQAGIEKNPKSAFWHNQASVAYNALGHFDLAVKELELAATLDAIRSPSEKRNAHIWLKTFLNWCYSRGYLDQNPISRLKGAGSSQIREHVLSDEDLARVWTASSV